MIKQPYLVSALFSVNGKFKARAYILRVDNIIEIYGHVVRLLDKDSPGYINLEITAQEITENILQKLMKECYEEV